MQCQLYLSDHFVLASYELNIQHKTQNTTVLIWTFE